MIIRISAVLLIPSILAAPAIVRRDTITITASAAMSAQPVWPIVDVSRSPRRTTGSSLTAVATPSAEYTTLYNLWCFQNASPAAF